MTATEVARPPVDPAVVAGRRVAGPLAVAAAAVAGAALLALVDPGQPGHYPLCPFRAVTGLDCPGCGTLRAVHELATGHPLAALDQNALAVLVLPALLLAWASWLRRSWRGSARPAPHAPWVPVTVLVVVLVWWVVRNLPGVPFLGSGLG
ncbi:MAG TPA: DUF2752 domain-containing protein [Candidatus Limnocylindria bacterium]|nr:DUF2752 domain-containing protein [Candidatus Limnocylindria bacterium]